MKRFATLPDETFRIHPWTTDDRYFLVHVAETSDAMRDSLKAFGSLGFDSRSGRVVAASCICCAITEDQDFLGVLFFAKDNMSASIAAHELAHAGFRACEKKADRRADHYQASRIVWWARWFCEMWRRKSYRLEHESLEEQYCYAVERMTRQFWREMYGRGLVT